MHRLEAHQQNLPPPLQQGYSEAGQTLPQKMFKADLIQRQNNWSDREMEEHAIYNILIKTGGREKMNHLELLNWYTHNRIDKIEHILTVLNRSGTASIEFYKGKPRKFLNHFGRGNPQLVNKDDEWDFIKIIYNGKVVFEFVEFQLKIFSLAEGYFYEEHFTEEEKNHIFDALNGTEIITSKNYFSRGVDRWLIPLSIIVYSSGTIFYIIYGIYYLSFLFFCCLLISLYLYRRSH